MPDPSGTADASLRGKCALITGSTQGLGLAAAKHFAEAGCHVVLNGYADADAIAAIGAGIERQYGVRTLYCGADLRIPGEIENMISTALEAFGSVDILVNNAVVRHASPVEAFAAERWDEAIAVNLSAAFHTIRLALPAMKTRNWGRIINVSSIYGLRGAPNRIGVRHDEDGAHRPDPRRRARNARPEHHLQRGLSRAPPRRRSTRRRCVR